MGLRLLFTFLKGHIMRSFWFVIAAMVLTTYFVAFEPDPNRSKYIPKSQRSKARQVLRKYFTMLMKSWLKLWDKLDERVSKLKTK